MSPKKTAPAAASEPKLVMTPLLTQFRKARKVSTPIVFIETPDPGALQTALLTLLKGEAPTFMWDCNHGLSGLGEKAQTWMSKNGFTPGAQKLLATISCPGMLLAAETLPDFSVVFFHNLHAQLTDIRVKQGVWNLRDQYKTNRRTLVGFAPAFHVPAELAGDVIVLDEPLPTRAELDDVLTALYVEAQGSEGNEMPDLTPEIRAEALDALVGQPKYTAESSLALSFEKRELVVPRLWQRKIKNIENNQGLRVWRPQPEDSLDYLKGIDNVVDFGKEMIESDEFGAIAFIDEGEKMFAGGMSDYSGDSGVAKDQVGTFLSYIQDTGSPGVMLAGLAGCGKSQYVKALGATARKPVIVWDMNGMKSSMLGSSEQAIRNNLKVLTATAQGRILFLMTVNKFVQFTPELNRRFPDQFFFDIPAENEDIWQVYIEMFKLEPWQDDRATVPRFSQGWTGAEIQRACKRAAKGKANRRTITQAARFIIPMSVSKKDELNALRFAADGKFISAAHDGWYTMPDEYKQAAPTATRRAMSFAEES